MKKLSLVLALVFGGCFAMAQHVQVTTQTGNANHATIDQSFLGSGTAFQGNIAHVTQTGNTNTADVDQVNNGYAGQAMEADVISTGNDNFAKINQNLEGQGDAIITQIGDRNNANIFQTGNFGAASPLDGTKDAFAYQKGNDNKITMAIYGTDATGYAWQLGDRNTATQAIGQGVGDKDQNSNLLIKQQGNDNVASQTITGNGFAGGITTQWNTAWASQFGNNNYSKQEMNQNGLDGASPTNDYEWLEQYGNNNHSEQYQAGQVNTSSVSQGKNVASNFNNSITTQTGNFNQVYVTQN